MEFLRAELNAYATSGSSGGAGDVAQLSWVSPFEGAGGTPPPIGLTVFAVEEERTLKTSVRTRVDGDVHYLPEPPLFLNLHMLVAGYAQEYGTALDNLSTAIAYFQSHAAFVRGQYPQLPADVDRIVVEMRGLDYEQQSYIWGLLGGRYLPSAAYRIRVLRVQSARVEGIASPVTGVGTETPR